MLVYYAVFFIVRYIFWLVARRTSEFEVVAHVFAVVGSELESFLTDYRFLGSRLFHLYWNFDSKADAVVGGFARSDSGEHAMELAAVACEHFYIVAYVFSVLCADFEIGSDAGRAYFEFVVLGVAVEFFFDFARNGCTLVYVDCRRRIDFDCNNIVGRNSDVDYKKVCAGDSVVFGAGE